jgi:hypothetical protein
MIRRLLGKIVMFVMIGVPFELWLRPPAIGSIAIAAASWMLVSIYMDMPPR